MFRMRVEVESLGRAFAAKSNHCFRSKHTHMHARTNMQPEEEHAPLKPVRRMSVTDAVTYSRESHTRTRARTHTHAHAHMHTHARTDKRTRTQA